MPNRDQNPNEGRRVAPLAFSPTKQKAINL